MTRISLATLQAPGMAFFGLEGSTAALAKTLTLSAVVSCIGIGFRRGSQTRGHLVSNDASAAPTLTSIAEPLAIAAGGMLARFHRGNGDRRLCPWRAPPDTAQIWAALLRTR